MVNLNGGENNLSQGTDMPVNPLPTASIHFPSGCYDDGGIEACYELLTQRRPLAEILEAAKRVVSLNGNTNVAGEPRSRQPFGLADHTHNDASRLETARIVQLSTSMMKEEGSVSSHPSASNTVGDVAHSGALNLRQSPDAVRVARFPKVIGVVLFWLIPAVSLTVAGTAGKSLIDAGRANKATAAAQAVPALAQPNDVALPANAGTAESTLVRVPTPKPQRVEAQIGDEVKALLDRGDALVSMAEIAAGRLFYERAAASGNAQAALRLAATYDPNFLAQAGLRNVSGDAVAAQYWYERARDLSAAKAEIPATDKAVDAARSSGEFATPAPPPVSSATEPTNQDKILSQHAPATSRADQQRPAASTPLATRRTHRPSRRKQYSTASACRHSGHCLAD